MGDVLFLNEAKGKRERLQSLWEAYLAARMDAEKTGDIADGIRAGKAWAAWLDAFSSVAS